jgi:cytosine/adenosine deaminase-related metal-dependent hydrolase
MQRTVVRNAMIVSMDLKIGDFLAADLLVDGTKIAEVRPNIGPVDAREIDGNGMIVIPGFVDTHRQRSSSSSPIPAAPPRSRPKSSSTWATAIPRRLG